MTEYTRSPQPGDEYKYWGWYGPAPTKRHLLSGALTFFIAIPLLIFGVAALVVLLILAITVPPIGIALLTRGDS